MIERLDLSRLASPVGVLRTLLRAIDDSQIDDGRLARLIARDPAFLARTLQVMSATSAGRPGIGFAPLEEGIAEIGRDVLRVMLVESLVRACAQSDPSDVSHRTAEDWTRAQRCAETAAALADAIGYASRDEAFLAGMLHDIGIRALLTADASYVEVHRESDEGIGLAEFERDRFGVTHAEVGAALADAWRLPSTFGDALLLHHDAPSALRDADPLVRVVRAAIALAEDEVVAEEAAALLGADVAVLSRIAGSARHRAAEARTNLFAEEPEGRDAAPSAPAAPVQTRPSPAEDDFSTDGELLLLDAMEAVAAKPEPVAQPVAPARPPVARESAMLADLCVSMTRQLADQILERAEDEDQVLRRVQGLAVGLYDAPPPVFFLPSPSGRTVCGRPTAGRHPDLARLCLIAEDSLGIAGAALRTGTALSSFDSPESAPGSAFDRQVRRLLRSDGLLCIPLVAEGRPWGLMICGLSATRHALVAERVAALSTLAQHAAEVLHRKREAGARELSLRTDMLDRYRIHARRVAHEAGNPLGIMKNYLQVLRLKMGGETPVQQELSVLDEEIDRVAGILRRLGDMDFASELTSDLVDINGVVRELLAVYGEPLFSSRKVALDLHLDPSLPPLKTDRAAIKQVLLNLLKNSSEAMPRGGRLTLLTADNVNHGGKPHVEIRIVDSGSGIAPEAMADLFKPGRSTKGDKHGGLGLSIVLTLLQRIGGTITCRSQLGRGTVFQILLGKFGRSSGNGLPGGSSA